MKLDSTTPQHLKKLFVTFAVYLFSLVASFAVVGDELPDYEREQRLADQIVDDIFDGEPIWLDANQHKFLGIHTLNEESPKGTVIIIHGRGYHPDWPEVAGPLRTGLVEAGWSTLSLQMPVLEKGKKYYDYLPLLPYAHKRIEAAIEYINELDDQTIVLAAHSCGAHMANDWLNQADDAGIDGYIIMGAGATDYQQDLKTPFPFAKMQIPIFDLYGEEEFPRPLDMVPERKALIEQGGNAQSKQQLLPKADHYFQDAGEPLTEAVAEWLNSTQFSN